MPCVLRQVIAAVLQRRSIAQPFCWLGLPAIGLLAFNCHHQRVLWTTKYDQALAPHDAGIDQISIEHRVMPRRDWEHDYGVLRPLGFMDRLRVTEHQIIQFSKSIVDRVLARDLLSKQGKRFAENWKGA